MATKSEKGFIQNVGVKEEVKVGLSQPSPKKDEMAERVTALEAKVENICRQMGIV